MQIDLTKPHKENIDIGIEYTKKIITSLKKKVKDHNSIGGKKVTFKELKEVFIEGVQNNNDNALNSGLARVNMFLRLLNNEKLISTEHAYTNQVIGKKVIIDLTARLSPEEIDFIKASEDIEKYNLNFNFKNIEDLYFEDYEYLTYYEEYL